MVFSLLLPPLPALQVRHAVLGHGVPRSNGFAGTTAARDRAPGGVIDDVLDGALLALPAHATTRRVGIG